MASQGPNSVGTVADDATVGTIVNNNPTDALTSNDVFAFPFFSGTSQISHYLLTTNFGFSIPSGATIDGILVEIERLPEAASRIADSTIKLYTGGSFQGTNKAAGTWANTQAYYSYGGAADLWGLALTESDVESSSFGVGLSVISLTSHFQSARVDHVRMTVYYTEGAVGVTVMRLRRALLGVGRMLPFWLPGLAGLFAYAGGRRCVTRQAGALA